MYPPKVYELTIPSNHNTSKITKMVQSMLVLLSEFLAHNANADEAGATGLVQTCQSQSRSPSTRTFGAETARSVAWTTKSRGWIDLAGRRSDPQSGCVSTDKWPVF